MAKKDETPQAEARRRLSQKPIATDKTSRWFNANPSAKCYLELWLDMAAKGETNHSWQRVTEELGEAYDCPFTDATALGRWVKRTYGTERYREAITNRRR